MGDEVRVTVIAAGFDRWEDKRADKGDRAGLKPVPSSKADSVFASGGGSDDLDFGDDDDFDVPSFLK
jgi:cell division protein FtsZ